MQTFRSSMDSIQLVHIKRKLFFFFFNKSESHLSVISGFTVPGCNIYWSYTALTQKVKASNFLTELDVNKTIKLLKDQHTPFQF